MKRYGGTGLGLARATLMSAAFVRLNYKLIAFYAYKFAASHCRDDEVDDDS